MEPRQRPPLRKAARVPQRCLRILVDTWQCRMIPAVAKSHRATFLKRDRWWVAWSEDVLGALAQGKTLAEAKANLCDAIRLMLEPVELENTPVGPMPVVPARSPE